MIMHTGLLLAGRSLEANVYISAQHTAIDPGTAAARKIPGPMYAVVGKLQLLSTHRAHGTAVFSSGAREAGSKVCSYHGWGMHSVG